MNKAGSTLFCTFDLFLSRNRMEQVLWPKNDPLRVILGVKGQYGQKIHIGHIAPRWKAYDSRNSTRQQKLIFIDPLVVELGVKYRPVFEKRDLFMNFDPKYDLKNFVKINFCWREWIFRVISFPTRCYTIYDQYLFLSILTFDPQYDPQGLVFRT
jgi:hypothetical protein